MLIVVIFTIICQENWFDGREPLFQEYCLCLFCVGTIADPAILHGVNNLVYRWDGAEGYWVVVDIHWHGQWHYVAVWK